MSLKKPTWRQKRNEQKRSITTSKLVKSTTVIRHFTETGQSSSTETCPKEAKVRIPPIISPLNHPSQKPPNAEPVDDSDLEDTQGKPKKTQVSLSKLYQ